MDPLTNNQEPGTPPQSLFEKLRGNRNLTVVIVFATLVIVAGIIAATIWSIMGGNESGTPNTGEIEQQTAARLAAERQAALLKQQSAEMDRIRQERSLATTTPKQIKEQGATMQKIIKQRGLTAPTQTDLQQQAQQMDALRASMK